MRALLDWYLQWHPPIMHDLHQAQTLLYTFSGQAPQNPNLDPILYGELPMMANFEMAQMAKCGMPGVWTHGYRRHVVARLPRVHVVEPQRHDPDVEIQGHERREHDEAAARQSNAPAAGGRSTGSGRAGGQERPARAMPLRSAAGRSNQALREWFRPWPATGEFDWSLRNNTNYGETGV